MTNSAVAKLMVLFSVLVVTAWQPADGSQTAQSSQTVQKVPPPQQGRPQAPPPRPQREITCPVPEVRTEITTHLPEPWWNTPQIGKLQSTGIQVIGGKKTLVCRYWAYGTQVSVMRLFPEGAVDCRAIGNHFVCR